MISDKNGIYNFFGYMHISMEDKLRLIKNAGFDCVSLWGIDHEWTNEEELRRLSALAEELGLEKEFLHTPYDVTGYIFEYGEKGEAAYKVIENNVGLCSELGIPVCVVHITSWHHPEKLTKKGLERLEALARLAESRGVAIAAENIKHTFALEALEKIDSPALGFCYDSGHRLCFEKEQDPLPRYASRLLTLHLHDNDASSDKHALPGDGKADWENIISLIDSSPYSGSLHLEVNADNTKGYKALEPEEFLQKALASLEYIRSLK